MSIYVWKDIHVISTAGIYHSAEDGLISLSSDGSTWITISDKNLGATTVFNYGDTLSQANCGNYYQRGNNYGFPFAGGYSTSSSQVNAQNYGPGNYYSSSTFRNVKPRDSSNNTNLRGGTTNTNEARKGPCDTGFHIPSFNQAQSLVSAYTSLGLSGGKNFSTYLKRPYGGVFYYPDLTFYNRGTQCSFVTSDKRDTSNFYSGFFNDSGITISETTSNMVSNGFPIRPFKNDSVQPTTSWTVLYQPS